METVNKKLTSIGKFLRKLRFENEESQDDMARRLGVTSPYISLLGSKQPLTKKLALKIISEYCLIGKDKDSFVNMVSQDIINRFWNK